MKQYMNRQSILDTLQIAVTGLCAYKEVLKPSDTLSYQIASALVKAHEIKKNLTCTSSPKPLTTASKFAYISLVLKEIGAQKNEPSGHLLELSIQCSQIALYLHAYKEGTMPMIEPDSSATPEEATTAVKEASTPSSYLQSLGIIPSLTYHSVYHEEHCTIIYHITICFLEANKLADCCQPKEILITISQKDDNELSAFIDAWAAALTIGLQHNVSWVFYSKYYLHNAPRNSLCRNLCSAIDELIIRRKQNLGVDN